MPEYKRAEAAFIDALFDANRAAASEALMQMRLARWGADGIPRHRPAQSPVQRAKSRLKVQAFTEFLRGVWKRRDEEARGIFRPPLTPEQAIELQAVAERFKRWMKDDTTATPFE